MPCSPLKVSLRIGETCGLHLRVEGKAMRGASFAYLSNLKMETTCSHETSTDFQRTTQRYIPEDRNVHNQHCEILTSCTMYRHSSKIAHFIYPWLLALYVHPLLWTCMCTEHCRWPLDRGVQIFLGPSCKVILSQFSVLQDTITPRLFVDTSIVA
jgi:hypothetical protein